MVIPKLKQPVLGICLGMQLMCTHTEEGNTPGLGIFDVAVKRFDSDLKVPQMGWNSIHDLKGPLFEGISSNSYMYLVHSFYVPQLEETVATSNYNGEYSVALQKDNFYAAQFHAEISGKAGEQILKNFLAL